MTILIEGAIYKQTPKGHSRNELMVKMLKKRKWQVGWMLLAFLFFCSNGQAYAVQDKTVNVKLFDMELWDQDGRMVKFKTDVIGDRVVAIVPFYTTCTTAYPILIFIFTRLQDLLAERLGKEVALVSVSVDPRTDIPVRLKAFARRQKARPGWIFLSGDMNNLGKVLSGIGVQYIVGQSLDEHQHIPLTLVGDARGEWKRFYGYPSPEIVLGQINRSLAARQRSESHKP